MVEVCNVWFSLVHKWSLYEKANYACKLFAALSPNDSELGYSVTYALLQIMCLFDNEVDDKSNCKNKGKTNSCIVSTWRARAH